MEPPVRVPNNNNRGEMVDGNVGVKIAHAGELIHFPSRDDMTRILECQICSEIPVAPIYICANGHSICSYCNSRVSKCGLCNGKLNGVRNYTLEEIINASSFTCMYESEGCRDIIKGENVIKHSADCNCQPPPEFQAAQQERQQQADVVVPHVAPPSSDSDSSDEEINLARADGLTAAERRENITNIFFGYLRRGGGPPRTTTMTLPPPPPPPLQPNANAATTSQPMRQTARMSTGGQSACRVPRPVPTTATTTAAESNATASAPRDRRTLTARRRSNTRPRPVMHMRATSISTPRRGRPSQSTTTGVPPPEQSAAGSTASTTRTVRGSTPLAHRTRARTVYRSSSSSSESSSSSSSSTSSSL